MVLTFELVAWMVDFGRLGDTFSRLITYIIFTTFYDLFLTDADEEVNK